jgi:hypothetical protein
VNPEPAMKKLTLTLALASLALAGCGDPFSAGVKAEKVCVRQLDTQISGGSAQPLAAAAPSASSTTERRRFDEEIKITAEDLAELQGQEEFDAELGLQSFKFVPPEGTEIETLKVVLIGPPGSGLPDVKLIEYPAPAGEEGLVRFDPVTREFVGDLTPIGSNLMEYLESESLTLDLDADAQLPAGIDSFQASLEVCASAEANYDYAKEIGL